MNEFLEKHGYFIQKKGKQIIILHKSQSFGCIHIMFVVLLIPCVFLTFFIIQFALALVPLVFFYFIEVDKRKKHSDTTILDFENERILLNKKKKQSKTYYFANASTIISTSDHIGGYASADRDTTEEYRREINLLFQDGDVLTLFSYVSDFEEEEPEVKTLINWLEKVLGLKTI